MIDRLTSWIEMLFAPTFLMLRNVPPREMMRLLTPF
jgi:hypothetical protein